MAARVEMNERNYSYRHGLPLFQNNYQTIPGRLRELAAQYPDKEGIVVRFADGGRKCITFSELLVKSLKFAKQLLSRGIKKRDYIALFIHNSIEWAIVEFGVMFTGAIPVTIGSADGLAYFIEQHHKPMWGLVLDVRDASGSVKVLDNLEKLFTSEGYFEAISMNKILIQDNSELSVVEGYIDFKSLFSSEAEDLVVDLPHVDPDDVCLMFSTSGSTGKPKYVPHTHVSILTAAAISSHIMDMGPDDIHFNDRPLGYIGGFPYYLLQKSMSLVTLDTNIAVLSNGPAFICNLMIEENITTGILAPYLVYGIDKVENLPKLKSAIIGGQRLSKQILEKYARFVANPFAGYGSTEALIHMLINVHTLSEHTDVLGYINPGYEVKIINDSGEIITVETIGEICIRSVCLGQCYIKENDAMAPLKDANGWFHTADMGVMMPDGLMFMKGRTKEIIKRATAKIFPAEIEVHLRLIPGVEDVVVIGVPDERLYEEICACVMRTDMEPMDINYIVTYALDVFQPRMAIDGRGIMPKYFIFIESFPKMNSGKIDRQKVSYWAANNIDNACVYDFKHIVCM